MDHHEPCVQQAAEWLRMMQNSDGGWGETCGSYDDANTKGVGPSTASQTAWAVMGLLAAADTRSDSLQRGVAYLLKTQRKDGSWDERLYTEPASRACSIWSTPCTVSTSRCWR